MLYFKLPAPVRALLEKCALLQGCLPHAAWRACPQPMQNKRIGAAVALGWGQHVLLLDVPLARHNEDPAAGMTTHPFMSPSQQLLLTLSADPSPEGEGSVIGCIWHFAQGCWPL